MKNARKFIKTNKIGQWTDDHSSLCQMQIDTGFFVKLKFVQFGYTRENKILYRKKSSKITVWMI